MREGRDLDHRSGIDDCALPASKHLRHYRRDECQGAPKVGLEDPARLLPITGDPGEALQTCAGVVYEHVDPTQPLLRLGGHPGRRAWFCQVGDNVVLQNGAVIGADGFGFAKNERGDWHKIVQSGPAVLEDGVEVQANACIDRATVGETRIRRGAKIDNLVQVGHACTVGENTMLCAQVGLAGSSVIGKNVILAGQVGVAGHLTIGDGAIATAQSGIPNDVSAGALVSGYPAMDNRQWLRCVAIYNRLPELMRELRARRTAKPEQMDSNE